MYDKKVLKLAEADVVVRAVVEEATKNPPAISVAVVDDSGILLSFAKMERTQVITGIMARRKAYTAAIFKLDTRVIRDKVVREKGYDMLEFDTNLTAIPGGQVITDSNGEVVGAIGISGKPTGEEDETLAIVGLEALERFLNTSK